MRLKMSQRTRHVAWSVVAVPVLTMVFGCSGSEIERVAVAGAVWVDGAPLEDGSIRFIPTGDTKGPEAAATVEDGFYELSSEDGPVPGTVRVEIRDAVDPGFALDDPKAFTEHGDKPLPQPKIPPAYNTRSQLTRTIEAGERNKLDFKISTKKR